MQMLVARSFLILLFILNCECVFSCNPLDKNILLSFYHLISTSASSPPPLNWSQSTDCCHWEGIACSSHGGVARATRLWLPEKHLSGTISPILAHLPFLTHLNLSHNQFSGPLPLQLFQSLSHLQTLDLSFNLFSGPLQLPQSSSAVPLSIKILDLSSNRFNGSIDDPALNHQAVNLISFNISNNTFSGSIPSSICKVSKSLRILDFSSNQFTGPIPPGLGECPHLQVFKAGANHLSGSLPYDLYNATTLKEISLHDNQLSGVIHDSIDKLSNLTLLELQLNELSGEIPLNIGLLSNLETLVLHTNALHGALPPSLMNCTKLTTLLLRSNYFDGEVSSLDFSKLRRLQVADLGNNNFTGEFPHTLCSCGSLTAVRFSHNQLIGEIPPCMASLNSLLHLAVAHNNLSNVVGALKILSHCEDLLVLIFWSSFQQEMMPGDNELLHLNGFQNLEIITLGACNLWGQIPSWIAKLRNLKQLDLSKNEISGPIPDWLGNMPSLVILNLTQNILSGNIPRQLCRMPALIADFKTPDLRYLPLPLSIDNHQYFRIFNLRWGLALGSNNLTGRIPEEIGQLKLLQILDLSYNKLEGGIPSQFSSLTNLEKLNLSGNHLTGKIPESLSRLHFLSSFSVADNDLEGEIPSGGQLETFSIDSFEGNPKLCGHIVNKSCLHADTRPRDEEKKQDNDWIRWYNLPFGLGFLVGQSAVTIIFVIYSFHMYRNTSMHVCVQKIIRNHA